jgi:phytoene dehydrogenase-like protein
MPPPRTRHAVRVVVVGGGFGGMAAAARLAKLGHAVTLLEAGDELGGSLRPVRHDGLVWDRGATTMTLPAVVRDLFRKSGRPLEAELEITACEPGRRHVLEDGTVLDLPFGSRGGQRDAIGDALGARAADTWQAHLDALSPVWEVLRRRTLDIPFTGRDAFDAAAWRALRPRRSLARTARTMRKDPHLQAILLDRHRLAGQEPRGLPAFLGVVDHVERGFGRWRPAGGMRALVDVLAGRLATRRVDVRTGVRAVDVALDGTSVAGVDTAAGERLDADVVVWTAPRRPAAVTAGEHRLPVAIPAARTYLGLTGDVPDLPAETFLHGDPLVLVRTGGSDQGGRTTWSVEHHPGGEDVVTAMARRGVDVRQQVVARVASSPADVVTAHGASPAGMLWQGWRSGLRRPSVVTSLRGLYVIGADVHPGPGLVASGLAAAQVAGEVGKA